ncbi:MAG: aminotransferase class V-fold PLP-dependent enzyme [Terracidiphilus sp.]
MGAAIDYVQAIGLENIARHERELLQYAIEGLKTIPWSSPHRHRQRKSRRALVCA